MKCSGTVNGKECGSILSDNAKFCPDCGAAAGAILTINCSCGTTVRGNHKFCHNCGRPVQLSKLPESTPKVCSGKFSDGTPCGFTLVQSLSFCPSCGTRNSSKKDQPASTAKGEACSAKLPDGTACGFPLIEGLTCCPKCGEKIPAKGDKQADPQDPGAVAAKQEDDGSTNDAAAAVSSATQGQQSSPTDVPVASRGNGELQ